MPLNLRLVKWGGLLDGGARALWGLAKGVGKAAPQLGRTAFQAAPRALQGGLGRAAPQALQATGKVLGGAAPQAAGATMRSAMGAVASPISIPRTLGHAAVIGGSGAGLSYGLQGLENQYWGSKVLSQPADVPQPGTVGDLPLAHRFAYDTLKSPSQPYSGNSPTYTTHHSPEEILRPSYSSPEAYQESIRLAQQAQTERGSLSLGAQKILSQHFPKWTPDQLRTRIPTVWADGRDHINSDLQAQAITHSDTSPPAIFMPTRGAPNLAGLRRGAEGSTLSHELVHAAYGSQSDKDLQPDVAHGNALTPVEYDAWSTQLLRAIRNRSGPDDEQFDHSPGHARALFQAIPELSPWHDSPSYLQRLEHPGTTFRTLPPDTQQALIHRLREMVQSRVTNQTGKLAAAHLGRVAGSR